MIKLKSWKSEPENYTFMAIFGGDRSQYECFVRSWLASHGDIQVKAYTFQSDKILGACRRCNDFKTALLFDSIPSYKFIEWWYSQKNWRIFYSPYEPLYDGCGVEIQKKALLPFECGYLPWEFEIDHMDLKLVKKTMKDEIVIIDNNGEMISFNSRAKYYDIYTGFENYNINILSNNGNEIPFQIPIKQPEIKEYELDIRLIRSNSTPRTYDPDNQVRLLQIKIQELQEKIERYQWLTPKEEKPAFMLIYLENCNDEIFTGCYQYIRDWVLRVPDIILDNYNYHRFPVSLTEPACQAIHILMPKNLESINNYPIQPPIPWKKLYRDFFWYKKRNYSVYVPEGYELFPPPPQSNEKIVDMAANCLWKKSESDRVSEKEILIFIIDDQRNEYRFVFNELNLGSLSTKFPQLNYKVLTEWLKYDHQDNFTESVVTKITDNAADKISSLTDNQFHILNNLWDKTSRELNDLKADIEEAKNTSKEAIKVIQDCNSLLSDAYTKIISNEFINNINTIINYEYQWLSKCDNLDYYWHNVMILDKLRLKIYDGSISKLNFQQISIMLENINSLI